ncbi:hypothetical protein [Oceanithermus sp.]|uniref:hypothetical protein n=1 Tax=Oceanithermus sp. TaxID=2268145 RepID=UPI0025806394|nr:hypothetical protein [Oceanithermus sp.]
MKRLWVFSLVLLSILAQAENLSYSPLLGAQWLTAPHPDSSSADGAREVVLAFETSVLMYQGQRCEGGEIYVWLEKDPERILALAEEVLQAITDAGWVGQWSVDAARLYFPDATTGMFGVLARGSTRNIAAVGLAVLEDVGLIVTACKILP